MDSSAEGDWASALVETEPLACPQIVITEAANVLRRLEHAGIILTSRATDGLNALLRLNISLYPFIPYAQRTWELRHNVTCYDASYVALAESLNCPPATFDGRLARAAGIRWEIVLPPGSPYQNG